MSDDLAVPGKAPATPTAAGIIPDVPIIRKQTYSATLSYIGITRRTTAWIRRVGDNWWKTSLALSVALFFLGLMYAVITVWYFIAFVLFGFFMFPYRLVRRSHRKQEHLQRQQLATMQAMLIQQQQALQDHRAKES
jgi:Flp pilus assembly protein TadB